MDGLDSRSAGGLVFFFLGDVLDLLAHPGDLGLEGNAGLRGFGILTLCRECVHLARDFLQQKVDLAPDASAPSIICVSCAK